MALLAVQQVLRLLVQQCQQLVSVLQTQVRLSLLLLLRCHCQLLHTCLRPAARQSLPQQQKPSHPHQHHQ
jgi:hypothetical protein